MGKTTVYLHNARRDEPDPRDYTKWHDKVAPMLNKLMPLKPPPYPARADLRPYCTPVKDQGELGACTAFSVTGLVEYFLKAAHGQMMDLSPMFTYSVSRGLLLQTGDVGSSNRVPMATLVTFGVVPEIYWPYLPKLLDVEPRPFSFAFAQNYQCTLYYRWDQPDMAKSKVLLDLRQALYNKLPFVFGFVCYDQALEAAADTGLIPCPSAGDSPDGGHSVMIVGFDDSLMITNPEDGKSTTGAFLFKNSWGTDWGVDGYGYIPYEYYLRDQAYDFWSVLDSEWVDFSPFYRGDAKGL